MTARLLLSVLLTFSFPLAVFAGTTQEDEPTSDAILEKQQTLKSPDLCEGKSGKDQGRCITDILKRIKTLRDEFADALDLERIFWYRDHASLGVTSAYSQALKEYTDSVTAKRKLFNEQQREIEKMFFSKQQQKRVSAARSTPRKTHTVSGERLDELELTCSTQKSAAARRICMRMNMRVAQPGSRSAGIDLPPKTTPQEEKK